MACGNLSCKLCYPSATSMSNSQKNFNYISLKVGTKVRVKCLHCHNQVGGHEDHIWTLTERHTNYHNFSCECGVVRNIAICSGGIIEILEKEIIKPKTNMLQALTSALKRALSPNLQKQYKAGLINGALELTDKGRTELLNILASEKEKEFTAIAENIIAEEEKK